MPGEDESHVRRQPSPPTSHPRGCYDGFTVGSALFYFCGIHSTNLPNGFEFVEQNKTRDTLIVDGIRTDAEQA
jgi:hypothetical protein